ncbi:MAG: hypothetical protein M3Y27_26700, partial [Acidobacteriota bacterium]|nr:hypothetical protein [Acidobacteriota bacterium]
FRRSVTHVLGQMCYLSTQSIPVADLTCIDEGNDRYIGGILLTNEWDQLERKRAAAHFKLEWAEMEARRRLTFEIYEQGKLTMDECLALVAFHEGQFGMKIAVVSNVRAPDERLSGSQVQCRSLGRLFHFNATNVQRNQKEK